MKKNLLKFLFILLPLTAVTVSCENDDVVTAGDLVGIWDLIYMEHLVEHDGVVATEEDRKVEIGESKFSLNEDGKYLSHNGQSWQRDSEDTWTLSGSYLVINYADGTSEKKLITDHETNRMKLSYSYSKVTDGVVYNHTENTIHMRR